ncbi:hypothetical protein [Beduini massiliensis]|uniref:hypothetical protein n=1 Tax=Beduini massiliensis TaxID=1585974 RepID=UPI00059A86D0|nr:hypothetical protein [Beduini massiliensis]
MSSKNDCSILMLASDKTLDLVHLNLLMIKKFWEDCPFKIYIGLENSSINNFNYNLNIEVLNYSKNNSWSTRVKSYIDYIDTEYIMIILDDFIVEEPVQSVTLKKYLEFMKQNKNVVNICLTDMPGKKIKKYNTLELRKKETLWLFNYQMGFWKTNYLRNVIVNNETPWESEMYGSMRAQKLNGDFLSIINESKKPICYNRGFLVFKSHWNLEEVRRLENKLSLKIDLHNRPVSSKAVDQISIIGKFKRKFKIYYKQIYYKYFWKIKEEEK